MDLLIRAQIKTRLVAISFSTRVIAAICMSVRPSVKHDCVRTKIAMDLQFCIYASITLDVQ